LSKLPILPDYIEKKLFIEGRDAWLFYWYLFDQIKLVDSVKKYKLYVEVKLKNEFMKIRFVKHSKYICHVSSGNDLYNPKVIVKHI